MFGLGQRKPHNYREMLKVAWENRDELAFAWRILNDGVGDGCALGTSGLSDWTIKGTHLCMVRLELMRLNTAPALQVSALDDKAHFSVVSPRRAVRLTPDTTPVTFFMSTRRGKQFNSMVQRVVTLSRAELS